MNGQMNNQFPQQGVNNGQMNNQYSQPVGQMPQMQPKKSLKDTIKELESKKVFMIAGIVAGVLMIVGVFFPLVTVKFGGLQESANLWDNTSLRRFVVILAGIVTILVYVLNKFKYLSAVSAGISFMTALPSFDSWIELSASSRDYTHLSLGFFAYVLVAFVLVALCIIDNIDEVLAFFNSSAKAAPVVNFNQTVQPINQMAQPTTPQPAMNQPAMNEVVCTGCGAKKMGSESFCTNCGKQF